MAEQSGNVAYILTWVTDQLAVGCAPMSHVQLASIKKQGVDVILNLCGEFCDLHDIERDAGFDVHYMPLEDEEAPDLIELERALAWMDEAIYLGKKVLIHCRHGIGRTGTVLNAYLLRRGLGHKLAGKKMKKLRSKPANFVQWWTVRKYGRQSGKLTARAPSLEFKRLVDLAPFFNDYYKLVEEVESRAAETAGRKLCGLDDDHCCRTPVSLTLVEALHVSHSINLELRQDVRLKVIEKAVETARAERRTVSDLNSEGKTKYCLSRAGAECPLLENGKCLLFDYRPLQCRAFGLDISRDGRLWHDTLIPALDKVSLEVWFAYTGMLHDETMPLFSLPDVVSGKFIEQLFKLMMTFGIDDNL
ncbi:protein-tyrosine phosphatase family protein [Maridesulfovibrio hydrothermalis]|uniref:Dual specificity protein phosphatase n=1 Tax=Maridesulfovibrio hydrothermalis AM13 = DSM 14728 TaxID=1121451 RepID=L0RBI5_9BACT|nr:dual specificity protein phosphatase family protein [Maridesulfovibrio hydrothermalis]CCO24124.1 Dual specificity protein phosphatase [Maridesulfovibrio hydrothermalis AM13 = DSM 14728]